MKGIRLMSNFKNRIVVVTGGAGYLSSHTVEAMLARAYIVRVLDLDTVPYSSYY